jgi:hypothetical protein
MPVLAEAVDRALQAGPRVLDTVHFPTPEDRRDLLLALLAVTDLHTAPIDQLGGRARWQHHPAVAALKVDLESAFVGSLGRPRADDSRDRVDAVAAMRRMATSDLVPPVYDWLAEDAGWTELVTFLALEGGPDAGFDDLVAACQIGLDGEAKVELARNYWDEMGNGSLASVHTELHHRLVEAIAMPRLARAALPIEALERAALGSVLATNRWLQPELVGALGLIELQAGPRCRKVVQALRRLDAPADAFPFYEEHAAVDPRHGKAWLEHAIAPLAASHPEWSARIVQGARWRSEVNARFFHAMARRFDPDRIAASRAA